VKRSAGVLGVAVLLAIASGLSFARAATTVEITASGTSFSMLDVTIAPGDSVRWTNTSGIHNLHFDDGSFVMPATPSADWGGPIERRFDTVGTYTYHCDMHVAFGMTGKITVSDGSTPPPTPTPTPPPGGGGGGTGGGGGGTPPATLRSVAVTRDHFCTKRSRTCKKPGVVLAIDLSGPAAVKGALTRAAARRRALQALRDGRLRPGRGR
jgi:plastocyanin